VKVLRVVLVVAGLLTLSAAARAQTYGCRASVSCSGPRGFSTTQGVSMGVYPAFSIGMSYSRAGGLHVRWNPPSFGSMPPPDSDAIDGAVDVLLGRYGMKPKTDTPGAPKKAPVTAAPEDGVKKDEAAPPGADG
jgi:hypothetical protein